MTATADAGEGIARRWRPHWPLAALTIGYPVWWLLGIAAFMPIAVALVMVAQLRRRGPIRLPAGWLWWAGFLVIAAVSVFTLASDAPGAVPADAGGGRILVWLYSLLTYLACTVAWVWIANMGRGEVGFVTLSRAIGWLFVWSTLGGLLGMLAPHLELRSVLESVLPGSLRSNTFVRSLVHPAVADVQSILGRAETRPKAPFPYANTWGSIVALTLPFLMVGWLAHGTRWYRWAGAPIVVLSVVPIVYSLNRGLWACLALGVIFTAVSLARQGRRGALVATGVLLALAAIAFVASPLGELVAERFQNQHSNDRREQLLIQTVEATALGSPLVGFGGTRDVQGSFASIAGGATPECPACGVPPLGTQGHLWMVIFSQGFLGAALFLISLLIALARALRGTSLASRVAALVLLFFLVQMFVYDTLGTPLLIVLLSAGIGWRERPEGGVLLGALTARVARSWRLIAVLTAVGLAAGVAASLIPRPRYESASYVLLIDTPSHLPVELAAKEPRRITIDTEAALVVARQTLSRVADTASAQDAIRRELTISAVPTTQVLVLTLTGDEPDGLEGRLLSVTQAYLETRRSYLRTRQTQVLAVLYERLAEVSGLGQRAEGAEIETLLRAIDDNLLTPTGAGEVVRTVPTHRLPREIPVYAISGLTLGLLVGSGWAFRRKSRSV